MKIDCPVCHAQKSLEITTHLENIPYFGEIMESTLICHECGYRYSDVLCLDHGDPIRYSLWVEPETLNARVVKSQSATIRIPELGLKVEPGPRSTAYISNIEGVIDRFQTAVEMALELFEDEKAQQRSLELLEDLEKVRNGEKKVKVIMEDPMGQSFIDHPRTSKRKLTSTEIKKT